MDSGDRLRRRRSLQDRLGLVCCGSTWGIESSTISIHGDEHDEDVGDDLADPVDQLADVIGILPESNSDPDCVPPCPRMNLAAALAAERHSRSTVGGGEVMNPEDEDDNRLTESHRNIIPVTPGRVSLMRLLEETDDQDEIKDGVGRDVLCCLCMGRKKGAAFIPCGHTFCRVCSRELWLNRGSCPLCNCSIVEILDIF